MARKLSTRELSLIAVFVAIYIGYSTLSSYSLGFLLRGVDTLLVRSVVFVMLAALVRRFGPSTISGLLSGLGIEFTTPSPVKFYILPSVFAYGLSYDLYMRRNDFKGTLERRSVVVGTVIASVLMSTIALSIFTAVGFFPQAMIVSIWAIRVSLDIGLGVVGALVAVAIAKRLIPRAMILKP